MMQERTRWYSLGGDLPNDGNFFNSTNQVNELDVSAWPGGTWNPSPPDLPAPPRQAAQAGFFGNGDIWAVGGINGATFQFLNEVWHRNNGAAWLPQLQPRALHQRPRQRSHHLHQLRRRPRQRSHHLRQLRHGDGDSDRYTHNKAYTDTKATANAVSSADAVSEWVKRLKELQSNRELRGDWRVPCFCWGR